MSYADRLWELGALNLQNNRLFADLILYISASINLCVVQPATLVFALLRQI